MPKAKAESAVAEYLVKAAKLHQNDYATAELSSYPDLRDLLQTFGQLGTPKRTTIASPRAIDDDFPDLALFEEDSQVLVLPIEVKPADKSRSELLDLQQGRDYARSFGGGHVLLTNLWQVVWAELDSETGELIERDHVDLVPDETALEKSKPKPNPDAATRLLSLLNAACSLHSSIDDAERVATLLAYHATLMAERVEAAGNPKELLRPISESMREGLGMRLDDEFFVSTIVQTVVYGVFVAWLNAPDPKEFDYRDTASNLDARVVAELFHQILDPTFVKKCDLRGSLEATARVLQWVDRSSFAEQFDDFAIEYFYEPFLSEYDPDLRDRLGVWYTPREIARYQVHRVHRHLVDDLEVGEGLADESVLILDPAVGTGTYLAEVLRFIYRHHIENGEPASIAAGRTLEAAYSRVIGFEVLPAALVICHLHLHRLLNDLGVTFKDGRRLRIYLTNSLLGWGASGGDVPSMPLPGLEAELRESLRVKTDEPVLVVLGNPPYEGYSSAQTEEEKELVKDWKEGLWERFNLRKHRLGNLYVRFWRASVRKIADLTGRGIISFITDRKWLGGRSFPIMREHIAHEFQQIVVDDLHGEVHDMGHPDDGSVFTTQTASGIQQGVAITTAVRTGSPATDGVASVRRRDFRGPGKDKRAKLLALLDSEAMDEGLQSHSLSPGNRWKLVPDAAGDSPALDEYLHFCLSGVQPVRDEAVMDTDRDALAQRMQAYFDDSIGHGELFSEYPAFNVDRKRYEPRDVRSRLLRDSRFMPERIVPFLFKPYDGRWLYWEPNHKLLNEARRQMIPYYLRRTDSGYERVEDQRAIIAARTPRRPSGPQPTMSLAVPGYHSVDPDAHVLPRIRPATGSCESDDIDQVGMEGLSGGENGYLSNVREEWLAAARDAGFEGRQIEVGDCVFYALLAVMHSPARLSGIGTDNDDFPGVPLPADPDQLRAAKGLGERIAQLVDPFEDVPGVTTGSIDSNLADLAVPDRSTNRELTAGNWNRGGRWIEDDGGTVLWNDEDGWRNVPRELWEYRVGGFPVLPKWLSYRHERREATPLSDLDLATFTQICRRIAAVRTLQDDCDALFQEAESNPLEL